MSYTDDDVTRLADVLMDVLPQRTTESTGNPLLLNLNRILDAVAPAIAARALRQAADVDCDYCRATKACNAYRRGRADALREAADEWDEFYSDDAPDAVSVWLRARAERREQR